jgi:hypothetical protein
MDYLRKAYDMDENYELLSWHIPMINRTIRRGDTFTVDGNVHEITELDYQSDGLGIYSVYIQLGPRWLTLYEFASSVQNGLINSTEPISPDRNIKKWTSTGPMT